MISKNLDHLLLFTTMEQHKRTLWLSNNTRDLETDKAIRPFFMKPLCSFLQSSKYATQNIISLF